MKALPVSSNGGAMNPEKKDKGSGKSAGTGPEHKIFDTVKSRKIDASHKPGLTIDLFNE